MTNVLSKPTGPNDKSMAAPSSKKKVPASYSKVPFSKDGTAIRAEQRSERVRGIVGQRQKPEGRYLGLCLPSVLARGAWGPGNAAPDAPWYTERVTDTNQLPAKGVAPVMASRVIASMTRFGWPSDIVGIEGGGGVVSGLPSVTVTPSTLQSKSVPSVTWRIDDALEKALSDTWGISLVWIKNTDRAYFPFARTQPLAARPGESEPDGEAALSSVLPNLLVASLFAHHLQIMLRARVGPGSTAGDIQNTLQEWANQYVTKDASAGNAEKAARPFANISIQVRDKQGRPGQYEMDVELVPHYRVEKITARLMLKSDLSDTGRS